MGSGRREASLDSAWRLVGADEDDALVGFARAFSDRVALAYLADVYVDDHTRDAHGLYERFGFAPGDDRFLERPEPDR